MGADGAYTVFQQQGLDVAGRLYEISRHGLVGLGAIPSRPPEAPSAGAQPGQGLSDDAYIRLARFILGGGGKGAPAKPADPV